ncbi:hypothetical protein [Halomarina oriensis]|uniref:DUF8108 domain-containing protein n=1 Tax=Halomarina oriensis TaxID=671145 RepID=A0A6B0GPK3_9EURY|nr:hypothetical protein [Halomarina oriensis]MWG35479.1 hypothetical protein [Halomarina oriensis]
MSDRPSTFADSLGEKLLFLVDLALAVGAVVLSVALPRALDAPPLFVVASLFATILLLWAANGARTHPVTTFGTKREVEYAVARDETCDECGGHVEVGEKRRFAERTFAFGVPLSTGDWGVNVYCENCREGDGARESLTSDEERVDHDALLELA